jgi:fructose-1,6-bisphosphatase II
MMRREGLSLTRERNLGMELVRVTEAAALSAARWMGRGDREAVDQAAVDAMRVALDGVDMDGVVVIGEGEKDEAPMLYIGEKVGNGVPPQVDVAVDPVDGTRLLAMGRPGAIAVVAVAERGSMWSAPPGVFYVEKLVVARPARRVVDIDAPVAENLRRVAQASDAAIDDVTVTILDRPRHQSIIDQVRAAGARIRLIPDGDVLGAIQAAMEDYSGVDMLLGIGGAPEAVLAAAAIKCVGGEMLCRIWPRNEEERQKLVSDGVDLKQVLTSRDLITSDNVFFAATGITSGELLKGVEFRPHRARTHSVMMRTRSGTVRFIEAIHRWSPETEPAQP